MKSGGYYIDDSSSANPGSGSPRFSRNNGEFGQTFLIERQMSIHKGMDKIGGTYNESTGRLSRPNSSKSLVDDVGSSERRILIPPRTASYGSTAGSYYFDEKKTIRFQVLVWNIGKLDVVSGSVPMTFRVSLFWNDNSRDIDENMSEDGSSINSLHVWRMNGRQKAFQQEMKELPTKAIEVPPLSILNVSTFETIGSPEIDMLSEPTKLMRWTCMYRATVIQDNLRVDDFPHDDHHIELKLGILSNRGKGRQWDRRIWKLALATNEDTLNSTRIPHGLIIDQARLPGFIYNKERGLDFQFRKLDHGIFDQYRPGDSRDDYLKVSLNVLRTSGYYDKNITPLLAMLNIVAVSVLTFEDTQFFHRGLITLNIAYVEMNIRMTADSHLPSVGYQIRLQSVLNEFFIVLMVLVLEAMGVYVLRTYYDYSPHFTWNVDWITGILAVSHTIYTVDSYYRAKRRARQRLDHGWKVEDTRKFGGFPSKSRGN